MREGGSLQSVQRTSDDARLTGGGTRTLGHRTRIGSECTAQDPVFAWSSPRVGSWGEVTSAGSRPRHSSPSSGSRATGELLSFHQLGACAGGRCVRRRPGCARIDLTVASPCARYVRLVRQRLASDVTLGDLSTTVGGTVRDGTAENPQEGSE